MRSQFGQAGSVDDKKPVSFSQGQEAQIKPTAAMSSMATCLTLSASSLMVSFYDHKPPRATTSEAAAAAIAARTLGVAWTESWERRALLLLSNGRLAHVGDSLVDRANMGGRVSGVVHCGIGSVLVYNRFRCLCFLDVEELKRRVRGVEDFKRESKRNWGSAVGMPCNLEQEGNRERFLSTARVVAAWESR